MFNADWREGLRRISAAGGTPAVLTRPDLTRGETFHWWPDVLPGGRAVLFTDQRGPGSEDASIAVLSLKNGKWETVIQKGTNPHYLPAGQILYLNGSALFAAPFARDGRVLLGREDWRAGIYGLAPGERRERDLSWLDYSVASDLSADGRTLLFFESGEGGGALSSAFLRSTEGSPAVRLNDGICWSLSRDARQVICVTPDGQLNQVPTKTGEITPLTHDQLLHVGALWLPDAKRFLFVGGEPNHAGRMYVQDVGSEHARAITSEDVSGGWYIRLSHDGQRLAVPVGAEYRTLVYPVNGGTPKPVPGLEAGDIPAA